MPSILYIEISLEVATFLLLRQVEEPNPFNVAPLIFFFPYNKMSVANILGPNGQILPAYIPSGAGEYVQNPMEASLNCAGFDIAGGGSISSGTMATGAMYIVTGPNERELTIGGPNVDPTLEYPLTVDGAMTVQGGMIVDASLTSLSLSTESVDISVGNLAFVGAGVQNITGVDDVGCASVTATGTVQGATVTSTGNITATGTIVPSQWNAYPQVAPGTVIAFTNPATSVDVFNVSNQPAGVYLINCEIELDNPAHTNQIALQYILSDASTHIVAVQDENAWSAAGEGIGVFSFVVIQPALGSIALQLAGTLNAGQVANFVCSSVGLLRLR